MPTYGITHLWTQGDPMTRFVAALLAAMSIASWSVMALKAIEFARLRRRAGAAQRSFREAGSGADGTQALGQPGTPFFELASAGRRALAHHEASGAAHRARVDLSDWLQRSLKASVSESALHLQRGLGLLASIGSTAPFVGLLGTTMGIVNAFRGMASGGGSGGLGAISAGIAEALVTTAFGLLVAIPAVWIYNYFTTKSDFLTVEVTYSGKELVDYLIKNVGAEFGRSSFTKDFPAKVASSSSGHISQ